MTAPEKQNRRDWRTGMARIVPMSAEPFQMKALQFCAAAWHIPAEFNLESGHDETRGQGRLASCELAVEARGAAAELPRCGCARACRGRPESTAAYRDFVGNRFSRRRNCSRPARRSFHPAGRRLRRDLRRMHLGEHRREAQDPVTDEPRHALRPQETRHSDRAHGWPIRQAAFRGHGVPRWPVAAEFPR